MAVKTCPTVARTSPPVSSSGFTEGKLASSGASLTTIAMTIGQQAVDDLAAGVSEKCCRDDGSHLRFGETIFRADGAVRDREVVPAHVKRRVKQADEGPVHAAASAETWWMRNGVDHAKG